MATERVAASPANPLRQLQSYGQSVWLDYIRRGFVAEGELRQLVEEDGLSGVTSNPTIFQKAIAGSTDYDDALRALLAANPHADAHLLYEKLIIEDIQMAADVLRPVYDRTEGADGFTSVEVSPQLARKTQDSIAEARRLWKEVGRPNVLIKIPATPEGLPAIEALISEGINVNVTLIFSIIHYEAVVQAYLRGLENNLHPSRVASVASLFVSRVDTAVDRELEEIGTPEALALLGKAGIANARMVYQRFREIFSGMPFTALKERAARVQRPLWASTGTKNQRYPDTLYVDQLIAPDTVNTMPPATLKAFREHGVAKPAVEQGLPEANETLARLAAIGVDLNAITEKLQADGVEAFDASLQKLLAAIEDKRKRILSGELDRQSFRLGAIQTQFEQRVAAWQQKRFSRSLWARDYKLWSSRPEEITNRLGWLALPETMQEHADDFAQFAAEIRHDGFRHVVLLGMGGSSLAPEVFQRTLGNAPGYPELLVLDSTHPAAVRDLEAKLDLAHTLFLVSSKSGTTMEPLSFFRYFWKQVGETCGSQGRQFAAVTDPGTPLEKLAAESGFRRVFTATPDVGGRYSALTAFGLVPAALIGTDVHHFLDQAWIMAEACASCVPADANPGISLGAALGELALADYNKVTFHASAGLDAFPAWAEQLIAESTGKDGKGIIPVAEEPLGPPESYTTDRLFVHLEWYREAVRGDDARFKALEAAGFPSVRIRVMEKADLGQEFFRWELAIAAAGAVLGIHPFNQPDVELAKELARKAMAKGTRDSGTTATTIAADRSEELARAVREWMKEIEPGKYIAIQAYLAPSFQTTSALQELRRFLRDRSKLATTLGYGPRFLHSTGQLHKGGPNTGLFLQLVDDPAEDVAVPESDFTFGALIRAQAQGDYQALVQRGRRVLRINLGSDVAQGLAQVSQVFHDSFRGFSS